MKTMKKILALALLLSLLYSCSRSVTPYQAATQSLQSLPEYEVKFSGFRFLSIIALLSTLQIQCAVMKKLWLIFYFIPILLVQAQTLKSGDIVSGPMLGDVEMRTASIWLQVSPEVHSVVLEYWKDGHPEKRIQKTYAGALGAEFNPIQMEIGGLEVNSHYQYRFVLNHVQSNAVRDPSIPKTSGNGANRHLISVSLPAAVHISMNLYMTGRVNPMEAIRSSLNPWPETVPLLCSGLATTGIPGKWIFMSDWGLWYRASRDRSAARTEKPVEGHAAIRHLG